MTILLINAPEGKESFYHIFTNVKSVTDFRITFQNGEYCRKQLCAKVELLSLLDVPASANYDEWNSFTKPLLKEFCERNGIEAGVTYLRFNNKKQFESLDLQTYI